MTLAEESALRLALHDALVEVMRDRREVPVEVFQRIGWEALNSAAAWHALREADRPGEDRTRARRA